MLRALRGRSLSDTVALGIYGAVQSFSSHESVCCLLLVLHCRSRRSFRCSMLCTVAAAARLFSDALPVVMDTSLPIIRFCIICPALIPSIISARTLITTALCTRPCFVLTFYLQVLPVVLSDPWFTAGGACIAVSVCPSGRSVGMSGRIFAFARN